jgi:hypothetical protein
VIKTRLLLLYNISCTLHQNVLKNGNTISLGRAFVCSEETPIAIMALRQSTALLKALHTVNSELRLMVFNKVVNIVLVLSALAIELKSFLKFDGHFETNLTKNFIIHVLVIYLKIFFV